MITIWRFIVTDEKLREERNHDWKLIMSRLCPQIYGWEGKTNADESLQSIGYIHNKGEWDDGEAF